MAEFNYLNRDNPRLLWLAPYGQMPYFLIFRMDWRNVLCETILTASIWDGRSGTLDLKVDRVTGVSSSSRLLFHRSKKMSEIMNKKSVQTSSKVF
jgi:hypothetical protein